MQNQPVKVLLIGSAGRSGSTLLDMLLGQADGFFSTGEMIWIWSRSIQQNQLCSNGQPFHQSEFWQAVMQKAFGGMEKVDAKHYESLRLELSRVRNVPRFWFKWYSDDYKHKLDEYKQALAQLYSAIQEVSGCEYIVDTSKSNAHAYMLNSMDSIDLYLAHLVRDSRAYAYSWQRKKVRPEIHWEQQYMPQYEWTQSARLWNALNFYHYMLRFMNKKYIRIRYEDFTHDPQAHLNRVWDLVGKPHYTIESLLEQLHSQSKPVHSISGNPMRFQEKTLKIEADVEWKNDMPADKKRLITLLTLPLLLQYGYFRN